MQLYFAGQEKRIKDVKRYLAVLCDGAD